MLPPSPCSDCHLLARIRLTTRAREVCSGGARALGRAALLRRVSGTERKRVRREASWVRTEERLRKLLTKNAQGVKGPCLEVLCGMRVTKP